MQINTFFRCARFILPAVFFIAMAVSPFKAWSQIVVNSTGGTSTAPYTTLGAAFAAVNAGTHTGIISIDVNGNTSEGTVVASLIASGQGSASYSSIVIRPTVTATISGAPGTTKGVIELDGADNVTIDGDIAGGSVGRDLTIENTTVTGTSTTAVIRLIGRTTAGLGADNVTVQNTNVIGNDNSVTTAYGIVSAGSSIGTTGYDNDNLIIRNNHVKKAYRAIYVNIASTAATLTDNVLITQNLVGSGLSSEYVTGRGIYVNNGVKTRITENEVFNMFSTLSATTAAIEIDGSTTVSDSSIISRNRIYSVRNSSTSGYGSYGINVAGSKNALIVNNLVFDINTINYSSGLSFSAFGIRLTSGTGHKVYYNSVNMFGAQTISSTSPLTAAFAVTSTTVSSIEVKNNIFNNEHTSTASAPTFVAMAFVASYNFTNASIDHNSFNVPVGTPYHVGRVGTVNYTTLANWKAVSQVGNPSNDVNSVPLSNDLAPFTSNTNLTIPSGTATPIESGGVFISMLGSPNLDYNNVARPAGTGTAPDIGAYEFNGVTGDFSPPAFTSISHTPVGTQCTATPRTVTANISDPSGVSSASINWSVDGVSQSPVTMTFSGGVWTGTIPAAGGGVVVYSVSATDASSNSNQSASTSQSYSDIPTQAILAPGSSICAGDSVYIQAGVSIYPIRITEITQFRTGTGATSPYPAGVTGADLVEFSNSTTYDISLGEWKFVVTGVGARTFTFPHSAVVPANGVLVLNLGTGTDNPSLRYFNSGGSNDAISSSSQSGYLLKDPKGNIRDAVATNGHVFPASESVTSAHWSGAVASSSGKAGVTRNGADNNLASDWTVSDVGALQTIGTYNSGLPAEASPIAFTWNTGATSSSILVSPSTTTSYILTVSDGTCSNSDTITISVNPVPANPVTFGDTICGQDTAYLSASGPATLNWYNIPLGGALVTTGPTFNVLLTAADTFYVESNSGFCISGRTPVVVYYTIPQPITATISTDTVCEGSIINMSGTSTNAAYSYSWTGPGLNGVQGDSVSVVPSSSGSYLVVATDGTCTVQSSTSSISVFSQPVAVASISPSTVCEGEPFMLSSQVTLPLDSVQIGTGTSFNSTTGYPAPFGNYYDGAKHQILIRASELQAMGFNAGPINSLSLYVAALSSTDSLVGWNIKMGHTSVSTLTTWQTGLIPVYSTSYFMPVMGENNFTFTSPFLWDGFSNLVIETCFNNDNYVYNFGTTYTPTSFTSVVWYNADGVAGLCNTTATSGTGVNRPNILLTRNQTYSYSWITTNQLASPFTPNATGIGSVTDTIQLQVTDPVSGCMVSDNVSLTVNPVPVVSLGADTGYCAGTSYMLDAGNAGSTYNWNNGPGTQTQVVNAPGSYSVVVTNAFNCSASDSVMVSEFNLPIVNLGVDTAFCPGLAFSVDAGNAGSNFSWNTGAQSQVLTITSTGVYSVIVTNLNGCSESDSVEVTIYPEPVASLGTDVTTCNNSTVVLNAGGGYSTYLWSTGETTPTIQVSTWGMGSGVLNYSVTVSNIYGCEDQDSSSVIVQNCTGVEENQPQLQVSVMPNPSTGVFQVNVEGINGKVQFQLLDLSGRVVKRGEFSGNTSLDISGAANGVYHLVLTSESIRTTSKLVKY